MRLLEANPSWAVCLCRTGAAELLSGRTCWMSSISSSACSRSMILTATVSRDTMSVQRYTAPNEPRPIRSRLLKRSSGRRPLMLGPLAQPPGARRTQAVPVQSRNAATRLVIIPPFWDTHSIAPPTTFVVVRWKFPPESAALAAPKLEQPSAVAVCASWRCRASAGVRASRHAQAQRP